MSGLFSHPLFERYAFEDVPLDRDVYLIDERWIPAWESAYLDLFEGKVLRNVGYISYAAIREVGAEALQVSWYPNIFDRFHEVSILLPKHAFVACLSVRDYDAKPHIFVKGDWLSQLHLRPYSAFVLVDAIGVKFSLGKGSLSADKLIELRNRVDTIAAENPDVAFISFADSLLLKSNWTVGQFDSAIPYSYEPERIIRILPTIAQAYEEILSMKVYAVATQGANEYADASPIHVSKAGSHISLNSLGLPFAQLLAIDQAARSAIHSAEHGPYQLYVDELFFRSLRFKHPFDNRASRRASYVAPMTSVASSYVCTSLSEVLDNLETQPVTPGGGRDEGGALS